MKEESTPGARVRVEVGNCPHGDGAHAYDVDERTLLDSRLRLGCPNVARRYRFTRFIFDFRANAPAGSAIDEHLRPLLTAEFGTHDIEAKLERWARVNFGCMWIEEEFIGKFREVQGAYTGGHYFPAMTGATSLVERVLNCLAFRLMQYFPAADVPSGWSRREGRESEQDWDKLIRVLGKWAILSKDQVRQANRLKRMRNEAVHFNRGYDFEKGALKAIELSSKLISSIFNVMERHDLFWIFHVPGEIWLRQAVENTPFVREFVLGHCRRLAAVHRVEPEYSEVGAVPGVLSDEDFIAARKTYNTDPTAFHQNQPNKEIEVDYHGERRRIVFV